MQYDVNAADLDAFVQRVDVMGGPASTAFQSDQHGFTLTYATQVDVGLDPFSETYVDQQLALYAELSGKASYETDHERMSFDIEHHVRSANSYGLRTPSGLVHHYLRIGEVVRLAALPEKPRALDLGAGWGLSSEFLATLGAEVTALDVNPMFVDLVNRRAARLGYEIAAEVGTFDALPTDGDFDFIMFYECLHHAVRPWDVLTSCARLLKPSGRLGLSGEPIQAIWWPHWGLRLDALSVYCIRKFGWFESGWSREFLTEMVARAGMRLELYDSPIPIVGAIGVASLAGPLDRFRDGWMIEGDHAISTGRATIDLRGLAADGTAELRLWNHRTTPLWCRVRDANGSVTEDAILQPGPSLLPLDLSRLGQTAILESEVWDPGAELGNGDTRLMSFHAQRLVLQS